MAKTGQPISDDDRKKRGIKHLLLYGIKMMVRRDNGGEDLNNIPKQFAEAVRGKTAIEAGTLFADKLQKHTEGIRARQKRTVEELERRIEIVMEAQVAGAVLNHRLDHVAAYKTLRDAINEFLGGEQEPPIAEEFVLL